MSIENEGIERHPEFYFHDGSIVLICTNDAVAFRVHLSILSRHSGFFSGLLDLPQPPSQKTMDGCPLVILDDTLKDLEDTMRAIYDPLFFDMIVPEEDLKLLIVSIAGILRVTTKYEMQALRRKCISIIKANFPSTLECCNELVQGNRKYKPSAVVQLIPLAQETNVYEVLPWAYYVCTQMPTDEIIKDEVLSWRDKALCLSAKERLYEAQTTKTHTFHFEFVRSPSCTSRCESRSALTRADIDSFRSRPHPLDFYNFTELRVCPRCVKHHQDILDARRAEVWNELPEIFQIGTWQSIRGDS